MERGAHFFFVVLQNRTRFTLEVVRAVRKVWPASKPLFLRLSSSDWVEGGTTIEDTVRLAKRVKAEGVDLIDCSSGGQRYRPQHSHTTCSVSADQTRTQPSAEDQHRAAVSAAFCRAGQA